MSVIDDLKAELLHAEQVIVRTIDNKWERINKLQRELEELRARYDKLPKKKR